MPTWGIYLGADTFISCDSYKIDCNIKILTWFLMSIRCITYAFGSLYHLDNIDIFRWEMRVTGPKFISSPFLSNLDGIFIL